MAEQPHIRTGFVRERRNLLLISIGLLAFQATGATLSKLELFGNSIDLRSPLSIALPLWVIWGYFLLRFYQYYRDLGNKGFRDTMLERAFKVGQAEAKRLYERESGISVTSEFEEPSRPEYQFSDTHFDGSIPGGGWQFYVEGDVYVRDEKRVHSLNQHFKDKVNLPKRAVRRCARAGWWFVIIHTTLVTEYLLPFMVGMAPPVVALVQAIR